MNTRTVLLITSAVVTRQLRRLEARGLLETTRGEIRVLDPVALAAHSEQ